MSRRHSDPAGSDRAERTAQPPDERRAQGDDPASALRPAERLGGGPEHDIVDEAGEGSFPSSDPPSWSRAVAS